MDDKELLEKEKTANTEDNKDFVFMREQIKSSAVNKKKLAKSTLISAISALFSGALAVRSIFCCFLLGASIYHLCCSIKYFSD